MVKKSLIVLVEWYQKQISPMPPPSYRYRPMCSNYMISAIEKHGLEGVLMGIACTLCCHPFVTGGDDPVPDHFILRRNKDFHTREKES